MDQKIAAWQYDNGRGMAPTGYQSFTAAQGIDAAVAFAQLASAGDVIVEPGTYNSPTITITGNDLRIIGSGGRTNDGTQSIIDFSANQSGPGGHLAGFRTTSGVSSLWLRDFVIQGAMQAGMDVEVSKSDIWCHTVSGPSAVGVRAEDSVLTAIHEVLVNNSGAIGIELHDGNTNRLYYDVTMNSADAGIMVHGGSDDNSIGVDGPNNVITSGNHGIKLQDSVGNVVKDNQVLTVNEGNGITVTNAASQNTIDNNTVQYVTLGSGILVDNSSGQRVINNDIGNVHLDGIALTTEDGSMGCTGCMIAMNGVGLAGRAGIALGKNSDSNELLFNQIGVSAQGNPAPLADGIHLTQDSDANLIDSNWVWFCGSDGLAIEDASDGNQVVRNHLEWNAKDGLVIKFSFANQIGVGSTEANYIRWNQNSGVVIMDNADTNAVTENYVTCNNQSGGGYAGISHNGASNVIDKNVVQHTPIQIAIVPFVLGNNISSCGQ